MARAVHSQSQRGGGRGATVWDLNGEGGGTERKGKEEGGGNGHLVSREQGICVSAQTWQQ